jgi:hypothetical protein
MGVRRYQNKDGTLTDPYCTKKTHPIMETINILRRIFIMCKKEEAGKKILNVMIIIEDIYDENIPIDKFNKEDLLKLHKTLMELQKGIMYSKEIES